MKAGIFSVATAAPLINPHAAPTATQIRNPAAAGAPPVIASDPTTLAIARMEPTERSIPPDTMTIVMPIAIIVITAVWRAMAARLPRVRKTGFFSSRKYSPSGISAHKAIRLMNGRNRFSPSEIDDFWNLSFGSCL